MTKTYIQPTETTKTGYELLIQTEDETSIIPINEFDPNNPNSLKLPTNPSNRKYFSMKRIDGITELTYKETTTLGARTETTPRKGLEEYLEGEDRELYLQLVEKAKKNREELNKKPVLTEREKLELKIKRLQEKLNNVEE